jgi:hypothetical protein
MNAPSCGPSSRRARTFRRRSRLAFLLPTACYRSPAPACRPRARFVTVNVTCRTFVSAVREPRAVRITSEAVGHAREGGRVREGIPVSAGRRHARPPSRASFRIEGASAGTPVAPGPPGAVQGGPEGVPRSGALNGSWSVVVPVEVERGTLRHRPLPREKGTFCRRFRSITGIPGPPICPTS